MTQNRFMEAALVLKRLPCLEQVLILIGLCGTGLVVTDVLRTGLATVHPLSGLLLAGSGALFWWRALHHQPRQPATMPPNADTGVLQSMAALDQQMLQQLDRAVSLSDEKYCSATAMVKKSAAVTHEIVLVDKTNPFGNGNLLPRGILREPLKNLKRADFIFITKSDGDTEPLRSQITKLNSFAEIIECRHAPRYLRELYGDIRHELSWLAGKTVAALSGIAVPQGFENFLRELGANVVHCERYADHHRYASDEIITAINRAADLGADALITTEKDAVRFPHLSETAVPVYFLRVEIEILKGAENFQDAVAHICFQTKLRRRRRK